MSTHSLIFLLIAPIFILTSCTRSDRQEAPKVENKVAAKVIQVDSARAALNPLGDGKVSGTIQFVRLEDGRASVTGEVTGLTPNSQHGFHIHEFGDCSSEDGKSAGGHFNPLGHPHAGPEQTERHLGDLGNIQADANGIAKVNAQYANMALDGQFNAIVGRSLIVHASPDDLKSQPSGNAGQRLACGVIGVVSATVANP